MAAPNFHRHTDFVQLFQDLATAHVDIQGFYRGFSEEDHNKKHNFQTPALILGGRDVDDVSDTIDSGRKHHTVSFFIVDKFEKGNPDSLDTTVEKCEEIAEEVFARILHHFQTNPQDGMLDPKTYSGFMVKHKVMSHIAGWIVEFTYLTEGKTRINPEKWQAQ